MLSGLNAWNFFAQTTNAANESFQRKSLSRMEEFRRQGATIILVSHDTDTILEMCHRTLWLDHGHIKISRKSAELVDAYRQNHGSIDGVPYAA